MRRDGTSWQIEEGCPQCGAPVTLEETDRILACPFCRTRLFLVPEGHFRYHIPPATGAEGELFYIPYRRLRGSAFTVASTGVSHRFVDANAIAADLPGLPPSLGLRPQVLKLRFDSPATEGRFIPVDRSVEQTLPDLRGTPQGVFYRGFIGETVSLIHAPVLLRGAKPCMTAFLEGRFVPSTSRITNGCSLRPPLRRDGSCSFRPFVPIADGTWKGRETL
jgi:DNA-directed RNA polymerase subunit RPC12/RpoP